MAHHGQREKVILFGGSERGGGFSDFWEWDGKAWARIETKNAPARLHTAMVYDPRDKRLVMFGGFASGGRTGDTMTWDGAHWNKLEVKGPAARAEHEGVYFPGKGLVIFGGITGQGMATSQRVAANDTWVFDGKQWRDVSE